MTTAYSIREEAGKRFLLLTGPWSTKAQGVMARERLSGLRLSGYAGWLEKDITFLRELPFLERLDLWAVGLRDLTPLYELSKLRKLSLDGLSKKVDFTKLPSLEDLHISHWKERIYGTLFSCKVLRNVAITGFPGRNLSRFASVSQLENLALSFAKIDSLQGAAELAKLVRLSFGSVNCLQTLRGLEGCRGLKLMWVEGAKQLREIGSLSSLSHLRTLNLTDCPLLESLRPITGLPELEAVWFFGGTNVRDGDLSVVDSLPNLKYAKFVDREHYSRKSAQYPKSLDFFK